MINIGWRTYNLRLPLSALWQINNSISSPNRLLSANVITFGHDFAIPIRTEASRLMEAGKTRCDERK
jgi:hypothetical protein